MRYSFTAKIYKVGINPCVAVPARITIKMDPVRGYIPVKGTINEHPFIQTLTPVKNEGYRLYVNGPMLKGAKVQLGDSVTFSIEQDHVPRIVPMPDAFKKALVKEGLMPVFNKLPFTRQKETLKYLGFLKTPGSLERNINKFIAQLKEKDL